MSAPAIGPLTAAQLPAVLDIWSAQRERTQRHDSNRAGWERPLVERRADVEAGLRALLHAENDRARALVATAKGKPTAYLIAHEVRLPRESGYRAYAPDHFLSIGGDDWGVAEPRDSDRLVDLYAAIAE